MTGALKLSEIAAFISAESDRGIRGRLYSEFLEGYQWTPVEDRRALMLDVPPSTADAGWDALLAATAEHLASTDGFPPPDWVDEDARFCTEPWFFDRLPSARADALRTAPKSFRRHGVFLEPDDLVRA